MLMFSYSVLGFLLVAGVACLLAVASKKLIDLLSEESEPDNKPSESEQ